MYCRYELKEKLNKLRLNQQRVWREYANRGSNEVGTTATGILVRRAKLLERSGILEEEEEEERQAEAEVRAEAARRFVESRTQIDRRERKYEEEYTETVNEQTQKTVAQAETVSEEIEIELQPYTEEPHGAHWINPDDLLGAPEFYVPEIDEASEEVDVNNQNDVISSEAEAEVMAEHWESNTKETENTCTLRRMHTSPVITMKDMTIQSTDPKRRIKSTVTLPDIVVDSTSDYTTHYAYHENEIRTDENDAYEDTNHIDDAKASDARSERLLPNRKQTVHSSMIQPAYFKSKTVKTKIHIPPSTLTPPQIRRMASPVHQTLDISLTESPKTSRNPSAKFRGISSPARTIQTGPEVETTATPKDDRKLTATLRRISSPNPPSPAPVFYSRSPSPTTSTEPTRDISPQAWSPGQRTRELKEKFLLESKLYVPKASKTEKRIIVPDKQEMLLILEDQKRDLQKRIDRFLSRQIRRSKCEQVNT